MNKDFLTVKDDFINASKKADICDNTLAQMIVSGLGKFPIVGEVIDVATIGIREKLKKDRNERLASVLEIIMSDNTITPDMVNGIEPIMAFAKMFNVARRLIRNDKLKFLANLYKNLILEEDRDYNQFEEYLERLESLSYRELQILFSLHQNQLSYHDEEKLLKEKEEQRKKKEKEREGKSPNAPHIPDCNEQIVECYNQTIVHKWKKFTVEAIQTWNIDNDMLHSYLAGLSKSGFCMQFKEMEMPMNSERMYYVTKYYENFCNKIT